MSDKVLCVGGPLDGQWVPDYSGGTGWFEATTPEPFTSPVDGSVPEIKKVRYFIRTVALPGWDVRVAVVPLTEDAAVLRAILQRDVADAMNIPRRLP